MTVRVISEPALADAPEAVDDLDEDGDEEESEDPEDLPGRRQRLVADDIERQEVR
jgi:hypothetical protein